MASYVGISIFEAIFALFAVARYGFGAGEIAAAFIECSLITIAAQFVTPALACRIAEWRVLFVGLLAMSVGLLALVVVHVPFLVYVAVAPLGAGMAFVGPMLTSEVSKHESRHVGAALGFQQSAQGLGQVAGGLLGMMLFGWRVPAPYVVAALILAGTGVVTIAMPHRRP
jgi:predicted MFS family arabinose efflux permease